MATTTPNPTIIIDTREQNPWEFHELLAEAGTLQTGDYSLKGLTHLVSVERKSLEDLLGCCGRERERFKAELQRMRAYRFRLLVVETDAARLEAGKWRAFLKPAHVIGSLAAWCAQFGLPVWLGGDHAVAGQFVERYLYQCARTVAMELEAVRTEEVPLAPP